MTGKANSVHDFAEQIGKKLAAAELMGAEGDVEGSIKLMEEVRDWRWKREIWRNINRSRKSERTRQKLSKTTGTRCLPPVTNNKSFASARWLLGSSGLTNIVVPFWTLWEWGSLGMLVYSNMLLLCEHLWHIGLKCNQKMWQMCFCLQRRLRFGAAQKIVQTAFLSKAEELEQTVFAYLDHLRVATGPRRGRARSRSSRYD